MAGDHINSLLIMVIICTFIMGFGFGGSFPTITIVVQASVDHNKRGAVTALNSLVCSIGQTISVAICGGILNRNIVDYFNNLGVKGIAPNDLYSINSTSALPLQDIQLSVSSALHMVFLALVCISMICLALSFLLPSELKGKNENELLYIKLKIRDRFNPNSKTGCSVSNSAPLQISNNLVKHHHYPAM